MINYLVCNNYTCITVIILLISIILLFISYTHKMTIGFLDLRIIFMYGNFAAEVFPQARFPLGHSKASIFNYFQINTLT